MTSCFSAIIARFCHIFMITFITLAIQDDYYVLITYYHIIPMFHYDAWELFVIMIITQYYIALIPLLCCC